METNEQRSALTEGLALSYTCEWDYVWARLMLERGMTYESRFGWRTSAKDIDQLRGLVTVLFEFEMENGPTHAIVGIGAMVALVSLNPNWGTVGVHVAARHHGREEVEQVRSELLVAFPRRAPSTAIPIRFWMVDGDNRVQTRTRYLECPEWRIGATGRSGRPSSRSCGARSVRRSVSLTRCSVRFPSTRFGCRVPNTPLAPSSALSPLWWCPTLPTRNRARAMPQL